MPTKTKAREPAKSEIRRFRGQVSRGAERVDREARIIHGYSVITKGPIPSHGLEADDETLDQVVELGNASKRGVKSRFGHPTMSADGLGTFLGRAKSFRRDGDIVRADLHIDETASATPSGDLAGYVLDLAESDPAAFGSSIAFKGREAYRVKEDGTPETNADGEPLPPLVRVEELHASDIVDEPAANSGLFSGGKFFTADCELSAKASAFLDRFLDDPDAVRKAMAFLGRYAAEDDQEPRRQETVMSDPKKDPVVEGPAAQAQAPAPQFTQEQLNAAIQGALSTHLGAERARVKAIRESAFAGQETLVDKAIDEGLSATDAMKLFIAERKKTDEAKLSAVTADPAKGVGPSPEPKAAAPAETEDLSEDAAKKKFAADADLKANFGSFPAYWGYLQAEKAGVIRKSIQFNAR